MDEGREHEEKVQQLGREILARSRAEPPHRLEAEWRQQRLLEWAMHNERFRAQLFRFVDVLPSLPTVHEIAEHLREYLGDRLDVLPRPVALGLRIGSTALAGHIVARLARVQVRQIARRFIAGETMREAIETVERLRRRKMGFTIDVLGEAVTSDAQADSYAEQYIALINGLCGAARFWTHDPQIDDGPDGVQPRVNVSLKLSALDPRFDGMTPERCRKRVGMRLQPILRCAREKSAFVYIDMEEYAHKDLIFDIFESILGEPEFRDFNNAGIVLQAYLRYAAQDCHRLLEWARRRGQRIAVRLVKGAYWDSEIAWAAQRNWPCPVLTDKSETDAMFEHLTTQLMVNRDIVFPAIATHNVRSLAHAIVTAERYGLSARDYEIQMLYGMSEALQTAIVERGLHLRIYTPYGPLIPGMGYLIRRLLENTSNHSFLRQFFTEQLAMEDLLASPRTQKSSHAAATSIPPINVDQFRNEPPADFTIASVREQMRAALSAARAHFGQLYPLVIGGKEYTGDQLLSSVNPSRFAEEVGRFVRADTHHADLALEASRRAWPEWRRSSVGQRVALLRRVADLLARDRFELAAWIILETGKPWREADAEVCEAIDFCRFYAAEAERLFGAPRRRNVPGETNVLEYRGRGTALVIAPWNFSLAILTGMTMAALVSGNCVIMKPAEQSSIVAAQLFRRMQEAGLPSGVANYLTGVGEEIGDYLVRHPHLDLIAFTGSRGVGLNTLANAARVVLGQRVVKRVIAEMGGKNAIIVDADADLDEAVKGITHSAFSYAGQKCSACSRVIVVESVHDLLVHRLVESTRSLPCGPAEDPATVVGPLIDREALERNRRFIEFGKREADVLCEMEPFSTDGYFVGPVIFGNVKRSSVLVREEIFGPVLAVMKAHNFEHALEIANDTDYALTGGVYSRSPSHLARARGEFVVGNLYLNRPIVGALVDRQPFGGLKLSGIGSKAGGPDYLLQFCEPVSISENTMRKGFWSD